MKDFIAIAFGFIAVALGFICVIGLAFSAFLML